MRKKSTMRSEEKPAIDLGVVELSPIQSSERNKKVFDSLFDNSASSSLSTDSVIIGLYKVYPKVEVPVYATEHSACFDVRAYLGVEVEKVLCYNRLLLKTHKRITYIPEVQKRGVYIEPGECLYIPTGFILDIPEGYKVNYYPRSGIASQRHIRIANCTGVIDSDFVEENIILIFNGSEKRQVIGHDDKLMQGEIVPVLRASFEELTDPPEQKTSRAGGFRSHRVIRNALVSL